MEECRKAGEGVGLRETFPSLLTHQSIPAFLPESISEPGVKPTTLLITPRATPPTAHRKITSPHHGLTTTPFDYEEEFIENNQVNAVPDHQKLSPPFTVQSLTTPHYPPRTPSPTSSPGFEDSGSGEPSGDDDMEGSGMEASGEEPIGNAALLFPLILLLSLWEKMSN